MKHTKLFLFIFLFLASCAAPATSTSVPTQTFTSEPTPTQEPTSTQTPIPSPTITPSLTQIGGGSGRMIFVYRKDKFIEAFPDLRGETNVFVANVAGTNLTSVTNGLEGCNYLKDVSPDGTKVLIVSTPH